MAHKNSGCACFYLPLWVHACCRYDEISAYSYANPTFSSAAGKSSLVMRWHSAPPDCLAHQVWCSLHLPLHTDRLGMHSAFNPDAAGWQHVHAGTAVSSICEQHAVHTPPPAGHFTQVVWRSSVRLGCAVQSCPTGMTNWSVGRLLLVCRSAPVLLACHMCCNHLRMRSHSARMCACVCRGRLPLPACNMHHHHADRL